MLKFLGMGSCFNYMAGNTAAYDFDKRKQSLFLIDCGESVFFELRKRNLLEQAKKVTILITHLHSDHTGSLPSVIFYIGICLNHKPVIIYPDKEKMINTVLFTVDKSLYEIYTPEEYNHIIKERAITAVKQKHMIGIQAYGYELHINGRKIYYSGDTNLLSNEILEKFLNHAYDEFYHEVTRYHNEVHHHIDTLKEEIPPNRRHEVVCMHFDDEETMELAKKAGFRIPKIEKYLKIKGLFCRVKSIYLLSKKNFCKLLWNIF